MKGFKKEKSDTANVNPPACNFIQLGEIFSRPIVPDMSITSVEDEETEELDIGARLLSMKSMHAYSFI